MVVNRIGVGIIGPLLFLAVASKFLEILKAKLKAMDYDLDDIVNLEQRFEMS